MQAHVTAVPVDCTAAGFLAIVRGNDSWTFLKSRFVICLFFQGTKESMLS